MAGLVSLGYIVSRATEKKSAGSTNMKNKSRGQPPMQQQQQQATFMESFVPGQTPVTPEPIGNQLPVVEMRNDSIEEDPTYVDGQYTISPLTGERILASDFTHNNMTPFYGGRIKQNMNFEAGNSRLDIYTGSGMTQISKKEIEPMFDTASTPFGNPNGMESSSDYLQSRVEVNRSRAGERPFEPTRVGPALGEKYGFTGKGGFQQLEIDEFMRAAMKTDELRTANNPKLSYNSVIVPGKHYVGSAAETPGEVRQYHPDRYYENKDGERFFVTNGDIIKETARPIQILNYTTRPETSTEYTGAARAQDVHTSYVAGSYKNPNAQQFETDGFHNADLTGFGIKDVDAENADYGRGGFDNLPNERSMTSERVMALNLKPADGGGATMIHYIDEIRPTRRAETIGNLRQAGMPVGFAAAAPAITVWDPKDIARTTVKEGTVKSDYFGMASSASAPTRLKVYDPDDIARPTQKAQLSAKDYYGAPMSSHQALTSHEAAKAARLNTSKQAVLKRRQPIAGNGGGMNLLGGPEVVNQRSRRLKGDSLNDRDNIQTRVNEAAIGPNELGRVKYRVPLANNDRIQNDILAQLQGNPYAQSLHEIAAGEA